MSTHRTELSSISLFVLLDLLGSPAPSIPSYFLTTHWAYLKMAKIEERLRGLDQLESKVRKPFLPDTSKSGDQFRYMGGIQDDHIPFMHRGVDILHIIPSSFPHNIWHTMNDDGEHLDMEVTRDWAKVVTAFAVEWMGVGEFMPKAPSKRTETEPMSSERTEL